ncbi:hypothetical protein SeMB42_g07420 [Synchytrium endobioticum]|uniref:Secreted protein n=1 Tax=Synchytrium endobioticum TaxID=286115 RepID=A0A507C8F6_9FUNG|nr:hypothetical protein SeMB42_g07420 [Synchytrium endobioticum]
MWSFFWSLALSHFSYWALDQASTLGRWWLDVPGPFTSAIHCEVWWSSSKGGLTNRKTINRRLGKVVHIVTALCVFSL